jgi:hypothetical protein
MVCEGKSFVGVRDLGSNSGTATGPLTSYPHCGKSNPAVTMAEEPVCVGQHTASTYKPSASKMMALKTFSCHHELSGQVSLLLL